MTSRLLLPLLLLTSTAAQAVVIRDDVDDAQYRVPDGAYEALADLPHEGHGVLIAPQWILTAAHAVSWHPVESVELGGLCLKVEKVVVHPGYVEPPAGLFTGSDLDAIRRFQGGRDDIALVKLAAPVPAIAPIALYRADDEAGATVTLVGKGATGNGATGFDQHAPHRTQLRRAQNTIASAGERYLGYVFDAGAAALPREGASGNGDSGGPLLIERDGRVELAGITAWTLSDLVDGELRPGRYGQDGYAVRVSRYAGWIDGVIGADPAP